MRSSEYKSEQRTPFDLICDAAKAKTNHERENLLTEALKQACIDVWDEPYVTPVGVLAAHGQVEAVNFLLEKGAAVGYAGSGYASVGNDTEVNNLLVLVDQDPFQLDFLLKQTTYGYTFCKDPLKLQVFLKKIKNDYVDAFPSVLGMLALGYSKNGKVDAAYTVLTKTKKNYPDKLKDVAIGIGVGLAYQNKMSEIEIFFKYIQADLRLPPKMINNIAYAVVTCLAERGLDEQLASFVEFCKKNYSGFDDLYDIKSSIAVGYGQGRNKMVLVTDDDYFNIFYCAGAAEAGNKSVFGAQVINFLGFSRGGHVAEVFELLTYISDYRNVALGFAKRGRIDAANVFFSKLPNNYIVEKKAFLFWIIRALFHRNHEEAAYLFFKKLKLVIHLNPTKEDRENLYFVFKEIAQDIASLYCNKKITRFFQELTNFIQDNIEVVKVLLALMTKLLEKRGVKEIQYVLDKISSEFLPTVTHALLFECLTKIKNNSPWLSSNLINEFSIINILGMKLHALTPEFGALLVCVGYNVSELQKLANPFNKFRVEYGFSTFQASTCVDQVMQERLLILLLSPKMQKLGPDVSARIVLFLLGFSTDEMRDLSAKLQSMRVSQRGFFQPVRERLSIQEDKSGCELTSQPRPFPPFRKEGRF